jgi:hypothetical protein
VRIAPEFDLGQVNHGDPNRIHALESVAVYGADCRELATRILAVGNWCPSKATYLLQGCSLRGTLERLLQGSLDGLHRGIAAEGDEQIVRDPGHGDSFGSAVAGGVEAVRCNHGYPETAWVRLRKTC